MSVGPGRLLASGRAADVYLEPAGRVRRRYRTARDGAREGELMRHARSCGFPVPEVFDADGAEILMAQVEGRSMLEDLAKRPWRLRSHAKLLARLHDRLHQITAPAWLESRFGDERALLHLDLHPDNVILTGAGPFVIDWTNAAAGPPAADNAQTWVLIASSVVPGGAWQRSIATLGRRLFLSAFRANFDRSALLDYLPAVARARLTDENLQASEQREIERVLLQLDPTWADERS